MSLNSRFVLSVANALKKSYKGGSKWTIEDLMLGSNVAEGTTGKKKIFFEMKPYTTYFDQSTRVSKLNEASAYAHGYLGSLSNTLRNLPRS